MTMKRQFFTAGLILFLLPALGAGEAPDDVLFVGNSFTYYNNGLHSHYRELRRAADKPGGRQRSLTISGGRLPEHAGGLKQTLANADWDVVVLQGYSNGPIGDDTAEPFRQAAREYAAAIRRDGAEPVFFMTWAYSDKPEMTHQLRDAYTVIGEELGVKVVPVGLAFERALLERDGLELIVADRKHPTLAGTYLAACTFYAALHGESPLGNSYRAGLDEDTAQFLQSVAWATWQGYIRN